MTAPVLDDSRIAVGNKLLLEGRVKEAAMVFDAVLQDHPRMGRANFYKGLSLHQSQSHAAALKWYEAALASGQNFTERRTLPYYMAWSYYYADQPEMARRNIEDYLEQDSGRADAHFLSGVIALEAGRMNDSELALRRAIELGQGDPEAERSMARADGSPTSIPTRVVSPGRLMHRSRDHCARRCRGRFRKYDPRAPRQRHRGRAT